MQLRHQTVGTPAVLRFTADDGAISIEVRIEADPESQPFWLGRFVPLRQPGTVRAGLKRWFVPAVSISEMEEAAALLYGRRVGRGIVHERLREDLRRLSDYGRTWTLYRMTVAISRQGHDLGSETVSGLGEHDLPFLGDGFGALVERLAGEVLARAV